MTPEDAIKWLGNLKNDIGNPHYECLWPYAQAIDEICELLKEQETVVRCKDCKHCKYPESEKDWCKKGHLHGNAKTWFCADGERR